MRKIVFVLFIMVSAVSIADDFTFTCSAPGSAVIGVGIQVIDPGGASTPPAAAVCDNMPGPCEISETIKVWPGKWTKICSYQEAERVITETTVYYFHGFSDGFESGNLAKWSRAER